MPNHNIQRLSEDIKREISIAIPELKDSRITDGLVTITRCELTNDMSYCKIHVSCFGGKEYPDAAISCLMSSSGFFKRRINGRIKMRKIPELLFVPDNSLDYYEKISDIIDNLSKREKEDENN
ncbi:MAG: 30S ribosome-binding factor RbfA [Eubacterium sp.]|jgi:ribosome-binding factor A|nr:30S ribosome-binding factor RbfA [Eubacterium sp.]